MLSWHYVLISLREPYVHDSPLPLFPGFYLRSLVN